MSVCAYFAFFFMCGYKFNQSRAMLKRLVGRMFLQQTFNKLFDSLSNTVVSCEAREILK